MAGFLGMRGSGSFGAHERPKSWREGVLLIYPNGTAPLTAIMSKGQRERVDDAEFNWWTKTLQGQKATVTGRYTDTGLDTAYVSGGVAADIIYLKMAVAEAGHFRVGHQVLIRYTGDPMVDCNAKVTSVVKNGANSFIGCKLLEIDDNSSSYDISDADEVLIIGSINPEGGTMPAAIGYDPTKYENYTQIFINTLNATRTALQTKYRTNPQKYPELKRETLEYHSVEMEKAFLFGIASENISSANNMPERTTCGLVPAIKAHASTNVSDYSTSADYTGDSWLKSGEAWLDAMVEKVFRYRDGKSTKTKLGLCGNGALLGIQTLIKNGNAQYTLTKRETVYGIEVVTWATVFGDIHLITHPLFIFTTTSSNSIVVCEPQRLRFRYVQDTIFVDDQARKNATFFSKNAGEAWIDGIKEGFLTEAGLEYSDPITSGYWTGVGIDNSVPA